MHDQSWIDSSKEKEDMCLTGNTEHNHELHAEAKALASQQNVASWTRP